MVHLPQKPQNERAPRGLQPHHPRVLRGLPRRSALYRHRPIQPETRRLAALLQRPTPTLFPRSAISSILPLQTSHQVPKVVDAYKPLTSNHSIRYTQVLGAYPRWSDEGYPNGGDRTYSLVQEIGFISRTLELTLAVLYGCHHSRTKGFRSNKSPIKFKGSGHPFANRRNLHGHGNKL